MKTTINSTLMAALAGIAMFVFASPALAQYKPTGDDGITASPKVRQLLDEQRRNHSPAPASVEVAKMPCQKCQDMIAAQVDYTARGANKPVILVSTHQCRGCGTDWAVTGIGKAKQLVPTHKCSGCGEANLACCQTEKGSGLVTKGMERNLEVAPLK